VELSAILGSSLPSLRDSLKLGFRIWPFQEAEDFISIGNDLIYRFYITKKTNLKQNLLRLLIFSTG